MFFWIEKILNVKKPDAFLLENVKHLKGHDKGNTLKVILKSLRKNYYVPDPEVFNAKDFGLPQNRERIYIVGFKKKISNFNFPDIKEIKTKLGDILMNYKKNIDLIVQINNKIIQKNSYFNLIIKDAIT